MSYKIDKHLTLTNKGSKGKNTPQWLVVHFVGATGQAWDNARYFRSVYRGASAHYFVDDGNIVQVVEDDTPAWHVGDGSRSGVGKYNGYHGYGATNNNSIGFELCLDVNSHSSVWNMRFHPETLKRAIWLIKQKQKQYNIPDERVIRHFDVSGKICPGNWQHNNWEKWWDFKKQLAGVKDNKPAPDKNNNDGKVKVNAKTHLVNTGETLYGIAKQYNVSVDKLVSWNDLEDPTLIFPETLLYVAEPKQPEPVTNIEKLAHEVIAGKHGTGDKRKASLGNNYQAVQQRVNAILTGNATPTPVKKSEDTIVQEVIDNKWGNGDDRVNRLRKAGYNPTTIQAKVNDKLLGNSKPAPAKKSVDTIAREVIDNKWGIGNDRVNRLRKAGYNPTEVQNRVNALLGAGSKQKTITKKLVDDVIAGKYGNGADREKRLRNAGYDPQAVQREVNKRF